MIFVHYTKYTVQGGGIVHERGCEDVNTGLLVKENLGGQLVAQMKAITFVANHRRMDHNKFLHLTWINSSMVSQIA